MQSHHVLKRGELLLLLCSLLAIPAFATAQAESAPSSSSVLEEVVITAERRQSTLQDTAASIAVFTGEDLDQLGVTSTTDMAILTPGLTVSPAAGQTQFYVRGVGNFAANSFAEAAVSFNVDGVYISRATTYEGLLYDIDRIEVLKGPQGTLYGRNSTGGAINLITMKPQVGGGFSGYLRGELGNYDAVNINGAVNIPLGDTFALRGAIQVLNRDGFYVNGADDADSVSGRLSALWDPSDEISLLVVADFQDVGGVGSGSTISSANPFADPNYLLSPDDPWDVGNTSPQANALLGMFGRAPLGDPPASRNNNSWGIMAQLDWNLGFGTVTFIPAYRDSSVDFVNYTPGFLIDVNQESDQTSLELRLASNEAGFFEWIAGVYYFDESIADNSNYIQQLIGLPPGKNGTNLSPDLSTTSWAVFSEGTFNITDLFRLVAGLRYTSEDKTMSGTATSNPPIPQVPPITFALVGDETWNKTTWKVGLEYDVGEANLLYFNIGTGFKAGGFYGEQQQYGNSYDPEDITAYSLGSKNRFLDNRLQINAELFYWDYKDHQESHLALSPGFYNLFVTENIGKADIKGIDIEGQFLITENDLITFQFEYLDAEFTEFTYAGFSPAGPPITGCPTTSLGGPFYNVNCDGFAAIRAPEWSGTVSYQHTFNLASGGRIEFEVRSQLADSTYYSVDYLNSIKAESYSRSNANLTFYSPDDRWYLGAWVRNIEDDPVVNGGFVSPFTPLSYTSLMPPRTWGVSFGVNF